MPGKERGWITFQTSEEERQILEEYCQRARRTKTEILLELVRSPGEAAPPSPESPAKILTDSADLKAMKISARNVLGGEITRIVMGPVDTEVSIAIASDVAIVSVITTASAENLGLRVRQNVYAVIKSTRIELNE